MNPPDGIYFSSTHSIFLTTLSLITCDFNDFIFICFVY